MWCARMLVSDCAFSPRIIINPYVCFSVFLYVYQSPCDSYCVCTPQGNCYQTMFTVNFNFSQGHHDHDYYVKVTVNNTAELTSTKTLKVSSSSGFGCYTNNRTWPSYPQKFHDVWVGITHCKFICLPNPCFRTKHGDI